MDWEDAKDALKKVKVKQNPSANPAGSTTAIPVSGVYEHITGIPNPANAPYNFVPLNEKVVEAEEIPTFDRYHTEGESKRYTGYIKVDIETKTPLFIRGTLTEDEIKQEIDSKNKPDFFSPTGNTCIPGSSIRGMTRTLVEIMSYGKFINYDDKRLYYRAVADTSRLGTDYKEIMVDEKNYYFPKIKAGIFLKINKSYVIYPSKSLPKHNGTQFYRINFDKNTQVVDGTKNFTVPNFDFEEIYFQPVSPNKHTHKRWDKKQKKDIPYFLRYAKLTSVSQTQDAVHSYKGFIIASGEFGNKKHMHWVINEPENHCIQIEENVINEYKNDISRDERADLIERLKKSADGVPCFYITDSGGRVISFGHTGMFRLAYTKTIGEHIPPELKDKEKIDITDAIFGNEKTFAGRVFFEDAFLLNPTGNDLEDEKIPKTLLGAKPTAFQHYLVQTDKNLCNHPKNLAHYNSPNSIRGYKYYWHKSTDWGKEDQNDFNPKIDTKIKPVKKDKTFTGRIRFENLSRVELGGLLSAIALPDDCCHKIGMGKPLGLGSVKITPTLHLSNRKSRYTDLLEEWKEPIQPSTAKDEEIKDFKADFEKYVLKKLEETSITDLWQLDRMKELKKMLEFNNKPADDKTRYMVIKNARNENEFKERKVLPKPTEVK